MGYLVQSTLFLRGEFMAKKKVAKKKVAAAKTSKKKTSSAKTDRVVGPQVGDTIPDFVASATSGKKFKLSQHRGKKVVLYFYPKDATPGCTIEGHEFTKLLPEFKKLNTEVYGISRDDMKSHEKFKSKQCFAFELLSDEDEKICDIFDIVQQKNMYGKMVMGIVRSTYVIDEKGKVAHVWRKVKAEGHAQEVLSAVKEKA
jgi:thioredoxin-dependent peroxiredoxin